MVKLVGIDHVGIGTYTRVGNHVDFHRGVLGRQPEQLPAPCLNGLESPADGKNIIRGLIQRGYSDTDIREIAGGNALAFFRRVMGSSAHKGRCDVRCLIAGHATRLPSSSAHQNSKEKG
jgi:microsomal dipeptidase-like Zn-dependent dipeptidase